MTAEVAFESLGQQVRALGAALTWLRTTVREDAPDPNDLALVEALGNIADDLLGLTTEALLAAETARQAVDPPASLDRAARALAVCQRQTNQLARRFTAD